MGNLIFSTVDSGFLLQKTGKIAAILALLCMAFFIKEPITVKSYIYKAFREVSRTRVFWQTRGWHELQGERFIVRFQEPDKNTASMVLGIAEKDYRPVSEKFSYTTKKKTLIVIYPTKESLGRSFGWDADESAMGVYWAGVIRVLSPNAWLDEADPQMVKRVFETEGPIAHELTHLMVDYITGGNYTRWFTEGIAQYEEVRLTGYQVEHPEITREDELYPLEEMDREFDSLEDQNLAYYQSLQTVKYLVNRYGEDSIGQILSNLGRGMTMDQSFRRTLGVSLDQFDDNFRSWAVSNA